MQFDHETLLGTFEGGSWYQANWQLNVLVNAGPNVALGLRLCDHVLLTYLLDLNHI